MPTIFYQTPRVKNQQSFSLQDSNSLPRDSEPLNLALSQMTSYEYDMLKLLLATSDPLINPHIYNCVPLYFTDVSDWKLRS